MKCFRGACERTDYVVCKHRDNGQLYCPKCARTINEYAGFELVVFPKQPSAMAINQEEVVEIKVNGS